MNVFSSGNLKLDLIHNFFLECGARSNKIRVYEMVDDPAARAAVGYLLVRWGTYRGIREGTGRTDRSRYVQALPDPGHQQQEVPGGG